MEADKIAHHFLFEGKTHALTDSKTSRRDVREFINGYGFTPDLRGSHTNAERDRAQIEAGYEGIDPTEALED